MALHPPLQCLITLNPRPDHGESSPVSFLVLAIWLYHRFALGNRDVQQRSAQPRERSSWQREARMAVLLWTQKGCLGVAPV